MFSAAREKNTANGRPSNSGHDRMRSSFSGIYCRRCEPGRPSVTEARSPSQRRVDIAANPKRRVRPLYRLGFKHYVRERNMFAVESGAIAVPELQHGAEIVVHA